MMNSPLWSRPGMFAAVLTFGSMLGAGCAALTPANTDLEAASKAFNGAQSTEAVLLFAGPELEAARQALQEARTAWIRREGKDHVDRLASVVAQRVALARDTAGLRVIELRKLFDEPNDRE